MKTALCGRDMRDVFQTTTRRPDKGEKGPPESFADVEKEFCVKTEQVIPENEKAGRTVNYGFPIDCD